MGLTSLQASMDPSDWLQGTMCEDGGIDSSSSPSSTDMLGCSRAMMERRLRPPHDQALKCPRCESPNTKFCYYNNYSLTQPRYFCKTCRRYWTKGGTLRNIPVGGGCRKNKTQHSSSASKRPSSDNQNPATSPAPHIQLPHHQLSGFLDSKYHSLLDRHIDYEGFLGSKFDAHGMMPASAPNNFFRPFGVSSSFEGNSSVVLDSSSYQRLMLPYEYYSHNVNSNAGLVDVKPSPKLLSLQWQDNNGGADVGNRESFGYNGGFNGFSSWGAGNVFNGYNTPSSTTNPLI